MTLLGPRLRMLSFLTKISVSQCIPFQPGESLLPSSTPLKPVAWMSDSEGIVIWAATSFALISFCLFLYCLQHVYLLFA